MFINFIPLDERQNQTWQPTNELYNDTRHIPYKLGLVVGLAVGLTGLTLSLVVSLCNMTSLR